MGGLSPTRLTLRHLRNGGWDVVEVTEKWNAHVKIRQDLFGFVDVLAVGVGGTLAVQTTTAAHFSERRAKIAAHPNLGGVLAAGWRVEVHGWRKREGRWELHRCEELS